MFPRILIRSLSLALVACLFTGLGSGLFGCKLKDVDPDVLMEASGLDYIPVRVPSERWDNVTYKLENEEDAAYYDQHPEEAEEARVAYWIDPATNLDYRLDYNASTDSWYMPPDIQADHRRTAIHEEYGYFVGNKAPSQTMDNVWYDVGSNYDMVGLYDSNPGEASGQAYVWDLQDREFYPMTWDAASGNWAQSTLMVMQRNYDYQESRIDHSQGTSDGNTDNPQESSASPSASSSSSSSNSPNPSGCGP